MARKSIADAVAKWQNRVSQSGQYYQQGVQNTTKDWATNATAAKDRRNQGLMDAINSGRIDAGIQRVGTQKWKANTLSKGVANWQANTPKAAPQYQAGLQRSYNYMSAADNAVANMPGTTVQQRIARAATWLQTMHDQSNAAKSQG